MNFLFALAEAWEDWATTARHAFALYRDANGRQRALASYDPVQTEVVNERIRSVVHRQKAPCASTRAPATPTKRRSSSSACPARDHAARTDPREPQPGRGTSELPYLRAHRLLAQPQPLGRCELSETVRELSSATLSMRSAGYLARAAIHRIRGCAALHRQDAEQLPNVGLLHLILPNATHHRRAAPSAGRLSELLPATLRQGTAFTFDLVEIGQYYLEYERLMDHWHATLPARVLTVQYEELVAGSYQDRCGA